MAGNQIEILKINYKGTCSRRAMVGRQARQEARHDRSVLRDTMLSLDMVASAPSTWLSHESSQLPRDEDQY